MTVICLATNLPGIQESYQVSTFPAEGVLCRVPAIGRGVLGGHE
jgi:hypothetical protein